MITDVLIVTITCIPTVATATVTSSASSSTSHVVVSQKKGTPI